MVLSPPGATLGEFAEWMDAMARGNRRARRANTVRLAAKMAKAAEQVSAGPTSFGNRCHVPLDVMQYPMRLELEGGQWRSVASIAQKGGPFVLPKMAPGAEEMGDHELTIKILGGACRRIGGPGSRTTARRV